ncbi:fatty acyl-CoA reductase 1-like [Dermacentor silvarum]|uniref:fatty acyl-CoA reductase 1-like n=1 Tax=Dermacentor silvarum TaxID=543639 RepID=UPI0021015A70|nr:fatty acyl-CoA reductase 1-like [Dermacentor silvarum]
MTIITWNDKISDTVFYATGAPWFWLTKGVPNSLLYRDRVLFITGGTGFIGKVLLEKLLRSCPVKRIYLLVRSKRGVDPEARIEELFKCEVFQRLKRDVPGTRSKVTAVAGDLALPDLGLSKTDMATIIAEVSVVFHLAATVKFYDSLKRLVQLNVMGTRRMVDICRQMPNLCAFVHVSTAYSNWSKRDVQEMVYPAPIDAQSLMEITESLGETAAGPMSKLQFGQPNNYALTKAVTESLLLDEQEGLPLAIVRPSVVTASWREPFPGWIDNYNGCTGIVVSIGMGLLRSLLLSKDCVADLIPVDVVANTLICVAWQLASARPTQLKVYNCTSSALQTHTWGEVLAQVNRITVQFPLPKAVRPPSATATTSKVLYRLNLFFLCYVPAFLGDLALRLTGKKAGMVAKYRQVVNGMDAVHFFTNNSWLFRSDNVLELMNELSPTDKQLFDLDIRKLDWCQYWDHYMLGIRKYLFKVEDTTLPQQHENV